MPVLEQAKIMYDLSPLSLHYLVVVYVCTLFRAYVCDWPTWQHAQGDNFKETVRGGRVADIPGHSIQWCDWPTWQHAQIYNLKESMRGRRVAEISAHLIQCCD